MAHAHRGSGRGGVSGVRQAAAVHADVFVVCGSGPGPIHGRRRVPARRRWTGVRVMRYFRFDLQVSGVCSGDDEGEAMRDVIAQLGGLPDRFALTELKVADYELMKRQQFPDGTSGAIVMPLSLTALDAEMIIDGLRATAAPDFADELDELARRYFGVTWRVE